MQSIRLIAVHVLLRLTCSVALTATPGTLLRAQPRIAVSGVARVSNGAALPNARIMARTQDTVITVRSDMRGAFQLRLPPGPVRLSAAFVGYAPMDTNIVVMADQRAITLIFHALAQQLDVTEIRDSWIGIRGVVADDSTMAPVRGAHITSMKRGIDVRTDSAGRFSFYLPKAERTAMVLESDGYLTRPAIVAMDHGRSSDVVLLIRHGEDAKFMHSALVDLSHRMGWGGMGMFVADQATLSRNGARNLADAIKQSGMLARKGIFLSEPGIFINGRPEPNVRLSSIDVATIDFVEVWGGGSEETATLCSRWPG